MTVRSGNLTLGELETLIDRGEIDTVIVAFPDMQGRLVGKRVSARLFREDVAQHGAEACNYLLAVDVEMNTVDGYAMSSWDTGYGDMVLRPDFDTLRRAPWLPGTALLAYGRALLGADLTLPVTEVVLAPSSAIARFRRLQAQACRLVQNKPDVAAHPEITRALEQDLVHALVNAIAVNALQDADLRRRRHADMMGRLEQALASRSGRPPSISELSAAVGVPERTLRMLSAEFLGMSPLAYARLRRLNLARLALTRTDPGGASVARVARKYGFSELGRFAAAYRAVFGEAPSATLRDAARIPGTAALGTVR